MEPDEINQMVEKLENIFDKREMNVSDRYDLALLLMERAKESKLEELEGITEDEDDDFDLDTGDETEEDEDMDYTDEDEDTEPEPEETEDKQEENGDMEDEVDKELGAELKREERVKNILKKKHNVDGKFLKRPKIPLKK